MDDGINVTKKGDLNVKLLLFRLQAELFSILDYISANNVGEYLILLGIVVLVLYAFLFSI